MNRFKRKFMAILLVAAVMIAGLPSFTYAATVVQTWDVGTVAGAVTAELTDDGVLSISGTGDMLEYSSESSYKWNNLRYDIVSIKVNEGITNIPTYAFQNCGNLISVEVASSVKSVANQSFRYCGKLESLYFSGDMTKVSSGAFTGSGVIGTANTFDITDDGRYLLGYNGSGIADVVVPEGVVNATGINVSCSTKGIKTVTYPDSVRIIGNPFSGNHTINHMSNKIEYAGTVPDNFLSNLQPDSEGFCIVGKVLFKYTGTSANVAIPEGVTQLYRNSFWKNDNIVSVAVPDSTRYIDSYAFYKCSALSEISGMKNLESLGSSAIELTALKKFIVPECLKSFGSGALFCGSLEELWVYNRNLDLSVIKSGSAYGRPVVHGYVGSVVETGASTLGLTFIALPELLGTYDIGSSQEMVFADVYKSGELIIRGTGPVKDFVSGVSFAGINSDVVSKIVIEDGITSLGNYCFQGLQNLEDVTFSDSVNQIGTHIFDGDTNLVSLVLTESVSDISDDAFVGASLGTVIYSAGYTPSIVSNTFDGVSTDRLYVNKGKILNGQKSKFCIRYNTGNVEAVSVFGLSVSKIETDNSGCTVTVGDYSIPIDFPVYQLSDINPSIDTSIDWEVVDDKSWSESRRETSKDTNLFITDNVESFDLVIENINSPRALRIATSSNKNNLNHFSVFNRSTTAYVNADLGQVLLGENVASMTLNEPGGTMNILAGPKVFLNTYAHDYLSTNIVPYTIVEKVSSESISLNYNNKTMGVGNNLKLVATLHPSNVYDTTVNWNSSDSSVCSVDSSGNVVANKVGMAIIEAISADTGVSASCNITVVAEYKLIESLSVSNISLKVGKAKSLGVTVTPGDATDKTLLYTSESESTATVDSAGVVTGVAVGTTKIHIKTVDGSNIEKIVDVAVEELGELGIVLTADTETPTNDNVAIHAKASGDVEYITLPTGVKVNSDELDYSVNKNGTYTFIAIDHSGGTSKKSITVANIDKIPPTLNVSSDYADDSTSYTIDAVDSESGVDKVTLPDGSTVDSEELPKTYTKDGLGDITIMVTDKAGNRTSEVYSRQSVTITGGSSATFLAYEGIPTEWTNNSADIRLVAYNPVDGVSLDTSTEITQSSLKTMSDKSLSMKSIRPMALAGGSASTNLVSKTVSMDNNGKINVTLTDGEGHTYSTTLTVDKIDKVAPVVTSTKNAKTYTVSATDTLSGVKSITRPDGNVVADSSVDYDGDGTETKLVFTVLDNAGNVTMYDAVSDTSTTTDPTPGVGDNTVIVEGTVDPAIGSPDNPGGGTDPDDPIDEVIINIPASLAFEITGDRRFVAGDFVISSDTLSPVTIKIGSVSKVGDSAPDIVAQDKFSDWNNLTAEETTTNLALKLGDAWLDKSGSTVVVLPAKKGVETVTRSVPLVGKYGKFWGNPDKLVFKYKLSLIIE